MKSDCTIPKPFALPVYRRHEPIAHFRQQMSPINRKDEVGCKTLCTKSTIDFKGKLNQFITKVFPAIYDIPTTGRPKVISPYHAFYGKCAVSYDHNTKIKVIVRDKVLEIDIAFLHRVHASKLRWNEQAAKTLKYAVNATFPFVVFSQTLVEVGSPVEGGKAASKSLPHQLEAL